MATSITARALSPDEYTVGWICAIPDELGPARAMLDERHAPIESQPSYDDNIYILGSIGKHNIAIACLPEYGVANAATAAKSMQATFRSLRFGLMVGVGGGIPGTWNDIRLGDIVVSLPTEQGGGVIQYDMGRREKDGFRRIGSLNKPPTLLRSAIPNLRTERGLPKNLSRMVADAWKKDATADSDDDSGDEEENEWRYPGVGQDILFKADFDHEDGLATCDACANQEASVIERPARKNTHPLVHYGNIASGNSVMKNAAQRDELAKKESVICFEMEAAGLMDNLLVLFLSKLQWKILISCSPCLVIRGISDYCDSHKNWQWQPYAAAVAAAYAKRLLLVIPPQAVAKLEPIWSK